MNPYASYGASTSNRYRAGSKGADDDPAVALQAVVVSLAASLARATAGGRWRFARELLSELRAWRDGWQP